MSLPPLAEIVVAVLLLSSGVVVLVAALGLWRLPNFFLRMHAPALASSLAAWIITLASIIHFSAREAGLALHVWLIIVALSITAPITTVVLMRAALFRRRQASDALPPPFAISPMSPCPGMRTASGRCDDTRPSDASCS